MSKTKTDYKLIRAYSVFNQAGDILFWTIRETRSEAIDEYRNQVMYFDKSYGERLKDPWRIAEQTGCTCRQIKILENQE
jgi:hypothetical protein